MNPGSRSRRRRLTGRAAILAVVLCAIVLSLAAPLREYLAQRSRIADLRAENQAMRQRISELEQRKRKLNDPEHIKRLARERLHFHMPGRTNYIVIDGPDGVEDATERARAEARQRPWFVNLWSSVQEADEVDGPARSEVSGDVGEADPAKTAGEVEADGRAGTGGGSGRR